MIEHPCPFYILMCSLLAQALKAKKEGPEIFGGGTPVTREDSDPEVDAISYCSQSVVKVLLRKRLGILYKPS